MRFSATVISLCRLMHPLLFCTRQVMDAPNFLCPVRVHSAPPKGTRSGDPFGGPWKPYWAPRTALWETLLYRVASKNTKYFNDCFNSIGSAHNYCCNFTWNSLSSGFFKKSFSGWTTFVFLHPNKRHTFPHRLSKPDASLIPDSSLSHHFYDLRDPLCSLDDSAFANSIGFNCPRCFLFSITQS